MKKTLLALLLTIPLSSYSDEWHGFDKEQHFLGTSIISAAATAYSDSPTIGFWAGVGIGAAKELYDYQHPLSHTASYKDFAWDVLGAFAGSYVVGLSIEKRDQTTYFKVTKELK